MALFYRNAALLSLLVGMIASPVVYAELNQQFSLLEMVQSNPEAEDLSANQGKEKANLCGICHGQDGNTKRDFIPNLAGQNPKYLIHQFDQFATGKRKNYVMSQLADKLTLEERVNLAVYFSKQTPAVFVPKKVNKKLTKASSEKGRALYVSNCQVCHGQEAEGHDQLPRLASQPATYLMKTLEKFKTNHRDRSNSPMTAIAQQLSNDQIRDVSVYLASF